MSIKINLLSNGEFQSMDISSVDVGALRNELDIPTASTVNVGGTIRQNDYSLSENDMLLMPLTTKQEVNMESVEYFDGYYVTQAYPIDYLLNPSQELAESISTGPQDEFFESLDTFNRHLPIDEQLAVTRTWRWKAGSFNVVKKRTLKWLHFDRKPSSLTHLVQRTKDRANYMQYYINNLQILETLKSS